MRKASPIKEDRDVGGDARVQRSKQIVLATTYELLTKEGFSGVTVDAVAERSGVAKTTIYRHWPSRSALLIATCRQLACKWEEPDTGNVRGDILALMDIIATQLRMGPWAPALPSVLDAAERDEELRELLTMLHGERMSLLTKILERGQKRGEVPPKKDLRELAACIWGPLFYRRWFSHEPLTDRFLRSVVDSALETPTPMKKSAH